MHVLDAIPIAIGFTAAFLFTLLYAGKPWWKTDIGQHIFAMWLVATLALGSYLFGLLDLAWVRRSIWWLVALVCTQRLILFIRLQRSGNGWERIVAKVEAPAPPPDPSRKTEHVSGH